MGTFFARHGLVFRLLLVVAAYLSLGSSSRKNPPGGNFIPLADIQPFPVIMPSGNDPFPMGNFQSITLPLKRAGRLFLLEARIDGVSGNLVFDTGATGLVLNKTYFRNYLLIDNASANGITGSMEKGSVHINRVDISGMYYENIQADIAELGHIENQRGVKIIGLLGFGMIRSFEIVINARNNELQLHRVDKKGIRLSLSEPESNPDCIQKIEPWRSVLMLKGTIKGKVLNFCFDTGAETNVISSQAHKNVLNTITIHRRSNLRGAGSATSEVIFGTMNDFILDKTPIPGMETIITDLDALSEAYGMQIDGMLGFNFLEKGSVRINLAKKQFSMHFFKSSDL